MQIFYSHSILFGEMTKDAAAAAADPFLGDVNGSNYFAIDLNVGYLLRHLLQHLSN